MMLTDFPLFPEQASTVAGDVDKLFVFLCVLTGTVSLLVFVTIFFLAIKYRRTPTNELAQDYEPSHLLEFAWIIVPSIIFLGIFVWGSWLYFHLARAPDHRSTNELAQDYEPSHLLEFAWIIVPSIIFLGIFVWGSWLYFHLARVPDH